VKILAIDPGTKCGWACNTDPMQYGTLNLATKREEGGGMRYVRLRKKLTELNVNLGGVDMVVYEEVRRHLGTDAAHVYGGITAVIQMWCEGYEIPYLSVPVGKIKKHATGKGNAPKSDVVDAVWLDHKLFNRPTEDEADAIALLDWAVASYGEVATYE